MICSSLAVLLLSLGCLLSIAPVLGKPADGEEEGDEDAEEEEEEEGKQLKNAGIGTAKRCSKNQCLKRFPIQSHL